MPKTRQIKEQDVTRIQENVQASKAVVVTIGRRVSVKDMERLRKDLRAAGAELVATKKTLFSKAATGNPLADVPIAQDGTIALAYSFADETSAAKIVHAFAKNHPDFIIAGGMLESRLLTAADVTTLAKLPGKQELLGILVGTLANPLRGLVSVLAGPARGLVTVLRAIGDTK